MTALQPGVEAPNFHRTTLDGTDLMLRNMLGAKIWLAFYRYAACPICNLFMSQVSARLDRLNERGLKMIAIFESKPEAFPAETIKRPYPRYLISDPRKELYELYEVETKLGAALHPGVILKWIEANAKGFKQPMPDGALGTIPAHFLIDESGKLVRVKYGLHIADHISIDEVEAFAGSAER